MNNRIPNPTRKFIKEIAPKFLVYKNLFPPVVILGNRRGGTTLLASAIQNSEYRVIDQPLDGFNRAYFSVNQLIKRGYINPSRFYQNFDLTEEEYARLHGYFEKYRQGRFRTLDENFGVLKTRILFKSTFGSHLLPLFEKLNFTSIPFLRHPYTQAQSCVRNGWSCYWPVYLDSMYFRENFVHWEDADLVKFLKMKNPLVDAVIDWYCSNAAILARRNSEGLLIYFYEDLIAKTSEFAETLKKNADLDMDVSRLNTPSASSFLSTADDRRKMGTEGGRKDLLAEALSGCQDKGLFEDLFSLLSINDIYDMRSTYPVMA